MHGIATSHGFVDANKRASVYLVDVLLQRSGYLLNCTDEELVETVVAVASGTLSEHALAVWFAAKVERKG